MVEPRAWSLPQQRASGAPPLSRHSSYGALAPPYPFWSLPPDLVLDHLHPTVARLVRALTPDDASLLELPPQWAGRATELLAALPPAKAGLLERRLDALARAAEILPVTASAERIFALGRKIEHRLI